jgi:hypothetical protein
MKPKVLIVLAILLSLTFAAPGTIHIDQPTYTAFGQHGGA